MRGSSTTKRRGAQRRAARAVAALVGVLLAVVGLAPAGAADSSPDVVATAEGMREHLEALQGIADANGGNRSARTDGYADSVAYVRQQLEAAGYDVTDDVFEVDGPVEVRPAHFERTAPSARTYVEGTDYELPLPGAPRSATGDLAVVPDPCEDDAFDVVPAGAVVLATLTEDCEANLALVLAYVNGGTGVLLRPDGGAGEPPAHVDLGSLPSELEMPALSVSGDVGSELAVLAEGATVTVEVDPGWAIEPQPVTNVLAERPGTGDEVVVVGAHLDSVVEGPGINDNGSGVAALLEIAQAINEQAPTTERTIRFAFWADEELGLLGSTAYVGSLTPAERDRIVAYLNADMVGSPNYVRFVLDPATADLPETAPAGSAAITRRFERHFDELGLPYDRTWTDGRSDDAAFGRAGIPVGGLFSGAEKEKTAAQAAVFGGTAGQPLDACYHRACDTIANVDIPFAAEMATALGTVALELAVVDAPASPTTTGAPSASTSTSLPPAPPTTAAVPSSSAGAGAAAVAATPIVTPPALTG